VNVDEHGEADHELLRLGVPRVPAVVVEDRAVHGWNPPAYARLLGVPYREAARFTPSELAARLDRVLGCTERLLRIVPDAQLGFTPPERDRTLRQLGYHVFRLSLAFMDAVDQGTLPSAWLGEEAPAHIDGAAALGAYGALVRARLAGWFEGAGADDYGRVVETYYGPQSALDLLERTTWHAAQHLRQLHDLAARVGVVPPDPLPAEAFEGLPLPEALW
jgi:hypothetical protein